MRPSRRLGTPLWTDESFAYADAFDEATSRYRGLRCGREVPLLGPESDGLLVKPEVAIAQQEAEPAATGAGVAEPVASASAGVSHQPEPTPPPPEPKARRFHGPCPSTPPASAATRARLPMRSFAHLAGLVDAKVTVTLEMKPKSLGGTRPRRAHRHREQPDAQILQPRF